MESDCVMVCSMGFPGGAAGEEPTCQLQDTGGLGLTPRSGRSPGAGNGN